MGVAGVVRALAVGVVLLGVASTPALAADSPAAQADRSWDPMPTYGRWHSSRIGGGGYVQDVVPSATNPQRYYAYVDVGGVYRSDDGGNHWRMLHGTLPATPGNWCVRGMLVDPRDDNKLIIATGSEWDVTDGIYVSDDAGKSWRAVTSKLFFDGNAPNHRETGTILARDPKNPDVVLAASIDTGLWKSEDNGATWKNIGMEHLYPDDLKYDRSNPDRLWLCARSKRVNYNGKNHPLEQGLFRSLDGGKTWTKLSEKSPKEIVQDPKNPDRLYGITKDPMISVSDDAGETWRPLNDGLALNPGHENWTNGFDYFALAAGPDFILVGSSNGTIYRLEPGQTTWTRVPRESIDDGGLPRGKQAWGWAMATIIIDPHDANHWFITDFFGLSQTHDAGKNWKITVDGIEITVVHAVVQDPTDPGVVHLGMADNAYFRSDDGGVQFHRHPFPKDAITCRDISLSPKLPARLYAVGPVLWDQNVRQVYVSIDRGNTWERSPMLGLPKMDKAMCVSIAVDPSEPYTAYLTVSGDVKENAGGIYRSTDGAKSWTWIGQGLPEGKPFSWMIPWAQGSELAVGTDGTVITISRIGSSRGIYRYDSQKKEWSKSEVENLAGSPSDVTADLLTPGRFFVAARDGAIYRSDDNGATWRKVYDKGATHVATDGAVKGRVAASTKDGVILSTDGGEKWEMLDQALPARAYGNMPAFIGERLVVGSNGSGAFWTALSPEGEKPVHAKAIEPATLPAEMQQGKSAPKFENLDLKADPNKPKGWSVWTASGKLTLGLTTSTKVPGASLLSLKSVDGPANGTAYQEFAATRTAFEMRGFAKATGKDLKMAQVAIQVFDAAGKQIAWLIVADVPSFGDGRWFEQTISLPAGAKECKLVVAMQGEGEVEVGAFHVTAKPSDVFP